MKSYLFYAFYLLTMYVNAQQLLQINLNSEYAETNKTSFLNTTEDLYQVNLITSKNNAIFCALNVRMEDELVSNESYKLFDDVAFIDVCLDYKLGLFNLSLGIENLLGLNDTEFAIEPNLNTGVIDEIYFSHEANFLVSTSISYTF